MTIIDPGHMYSLECYDGNIIQILGFMKREGPGYPGNVGTYPGTNIQEVIRVLINRTMYLNNQIYSRFNGSVIQHLRGALIDLEQRAAIRHGANFTVSGDYIEQIPTCKICGHIVCNH